MLEVAAVDCVRVLLGHTVVPRSGLDLGPDHGEVLRPHPVTPLAADPFDLLERAARAHSHHRLLGRLSAVEHDVAELQPVAGRERGDVVGGPGGHPELAADPVDDDARACGRQVDLEVAGEVTHLIIVSLDGRQQRVPQPGSWEFPGRREFPPGVAEREQPGA